jgi:flagellar hook-basal body complex protein FliE
MTVTPISFPTISTTTPAAAVVAPTGPQGPSHDFGNLVANGIDQLESLNDNAANLSVKAATGDLNSIHDYTIAATEATTATQLTVAVTNKAIEAFNSIMNMQV